MSGKWIVGDFRARQSSNVVGGQGWCGPAPKRKRRPEGLRNPSPLCLTPCIDQVRGAASTVWRNGVEGFLVATAGARDAGACAIG